MDASFLSFALIGALVGYIIGDFQRERRLRREVRNNLARANARADTLRRNAVSGAFQLAGNHESDTGPDSDSDSDRVALAYFERRAARSRAVRGAHSGTRPDPDVYRRGSHRADEASMSTAAKIAVM